MGGEGKEGGERAVRLLPGKGRRALPHPPVPSPSQPPPRELSRERRAPTPPLPLRSPGPQRSGHLGSGGPRPASAGWPPGRSRPVHPVGGCGQWQSAPSCLAGCQRSGRKLASTLGCQGPALRDGIASRVLPTSITENLPLQTYPGTTWTTSFIQNSCTPPSQSGRSMCDHSSATRDRTCAPSSGNTVLTTRLPPKSQQTYFNCFHYPPTYISFKNKII
ncbi:serine/threonine-protein kinase LMTK3-like isoform X1 [Bubalus kerabau]|uniref:serine/threonine-protein kinase LMTK3-like isoform X1 n=1 Tax=Bubalus carabanensis TaxID=3119969 RepID=UPI00244E9653|nr:serine/threonine-protein kinase LMTK3-like isoform X1 [Bubalus carabanensis]